MLQFHSDERVREHRLQLHLLFAAARRVLAVPLLTWMVPSPVRLQVHFTQNHDDGAISYLL